MPVRLGPRFWGKPRSQRSLGVELWFAGRNLLVCTFSANVEAEAANACLSDYEFSMNELQSDLAFVFRVFGFENRSIAFDFRDSAALTDICCRPVSIFVFKNAREFDLKFLLAESPDLEFVLLVLPRAVDLLRCHVVLRADCDRRDQRERDHE